MDQQTKAMLFEGMNLSEMSVAFGMDHRVLVEKIHGIKPSGVRNGANVWKIKDVYSALWRPNVEQIDAAMHRLNPADLPKMLTKEYWAGLRSRQEYKLRDGDLWPTVKVVTEVSELLKLVKMQALLTADAVERQTELSDKQRAIIKGLMDGMLHDLHKAVTEKFKEPQGNGRDAEDQEL